MGRGVLAGFVFLLAGPAVAQPKKYASKGVYELGGAGLISYESRSPGGSESTVTLAPFIGGFVVRGLEIFAGPVLLLQNETDDADPDDFTAGIGLTGGVGYYFEAGTVFVGPRAAIGGITTSTDHGDGLRTSGSVFSIGGAFALRAPIGFGGVVDLALALNRLALHAEIHDDTVLGDESTDATVISVGLGLGFLIFF